MEETTFYGYEARLGQTKMQLDVAGLRPSTRHHIYYNGEKIDVADIDPNYAGMGQNVATDDGGKMHVEFYVRKTSVQAQDATETSLVGAAKQLAPAEIVITSYDAPRLPANWKDLAPSHVVFAEEWNPKFLQSGANTAQTSKYTTTSNVYRTYQGDVSRFNIAQTVQIDPDAVQRSDTAFISSIDLYFKVKPSIAAGTSATLMTDPGVVVSICACEDGVPIINEQFTQRYARVKFPNITANPTTLPAPTKFTFPIPVPVPTGKKFAILIGFDGSEQFDLWTAKSGDQDVVTGRIVETSSGYVDGNLFAITNGRQLTPSHGEDLTFRLNVARFTSSEKTYTVTNRSTEFLSFDPASVANGSFSAGEMVFQVSANQVGTVAVTAGSNVVTGNGTFFSNTLNVGKTFVVSNGSSYALLTVSTVSSNTTLTLLKPASVTLNTPNTSYQLAVSGLLADIDNIGDTMTLTRSTAANGTFRFDVGGRIVGIDSKAAATITSVMNKRVNSFVPNINVLTPSKTEGIVSVNIVNDELAQSAANKMQVRPAQLVRVSKYPAVVASRSNEVSAPTNLFDGARSLQYDVKLTTENQYVTPVLYENEASSVVSEYNINDDSTGEHTAYGNALSKAVTKPITLVNDQLSEDLRVYVTAHRPVGTTVKVYARIYNDEDGDGFSSKNWTELAVVQNEQSAKYSDPNSEDDDVQLEFQIPPYHQGVTAPGTFTTTLGSNVIVGSTPLVGFAFDVGDVIRVYNPVFPANFFHTVVTNVSGSTLTIAGDGAPGSTNVSNSSLVSTGMLVDRIDTLKSSAFINNQNHNIVRYYDSNGVSYDTYKQFALKFVLLSNDTTKAPLIKDYRAIAVSA